MNEIHQRMIVRCVVHEAQAQLFTFFRERVASRAISIAQPDRAVQIALRSPVIVPSLATEIVLQRDVIATVSAAAEDKLGGENRVAWEPAGGGPFPRFSGTLRLEEADADLCYLVLEGTYCSATAPKAAREESTLAYRITVATARSLLSEIRVSLERSYRLSGGSHTSR
jgi:hypothetical protein